MFVGILIAANQVEGNGGDDYFTADKAWVYITLLTLGYMLSQSPARASRTTPAAATTSYMFRFAKRPGRRTEVRFMPGCLMGSILLSIGLTVLINVLIRLF